MKRSTKTVLLITLLTSILMVAFYSNLNASFQNEDTNRTSLQNTESENDDESDGNFCGAGDIEWNKNRALQFKKKKAK